MEERTQERMEVNELQMEMEEDGAEEMEVEMFEEWLDDEREEESSEMEEEWLEEEWLEENMESETLDAEGDWDGLEEDEVVEIMEDNEREDVAAERDVGHSIPEVSVFITCYLPPI